jgi:DUF2075 family protein
MSKAYYQSSVENFLKVHEDEIIGKLNKAGTSFASQWTITTTSWDSSIQILKNSFFELIELYPQVKFWHIFLEYEIPRLATRIDAVLIADDLIFVIEFKFDRRKYELADIRQVEDYANDLYDFHFESRNKTIIPILLAPLAKAILVETNTNDDVFIKPCLKTNAINFSRIVYDSYFSNHNKSNEKINPTRWEGSEYQPTPSIIHAAKLLFAGQSVETITISGAEQNDLDDTTHHIIDVINEARIKDKKIVCFLTGVPGAGKTLVGLNLVHEKEEFGGEETNTAYFSGNGPLINVLREALSRDHFERQNKLFQIRARSKRPVKKDSEREVKSKIQNLHQFIKDSIRRDSPPTERIVVFDEAQRCWDAKQFSNKSKQNKNREKNPFPIEYKSEAELLFEFMSRHEGWAVIIALVGGGQEINTGEGGISEWGKALANKYNNWEIHISEQLLSGDSSTAGNTLFNIVPENMTIHKNQFLHLSVSQRSFKANNLNSWVSALINNQPENAFKLANSIRDNYPLMITRDIGRAKEWLNHKRSGTKRIGLIASSGGLRLKPHGIHVREVIDEALWFLNDETDVRSSYYLEMVATEYKVQGLELDWVGVCWDVDLRRNSSGWDFRNFSGTKWNQTKSMEEQQFLLNTYRVLLTRAREGMIVFVPEGDETDNTCSPLFYDPIYEYLKSCGLIAF